MSKEIIKPQSIIFSSKDRDISYIDTNDYEIDVQKHTKVHDIKLGSIELGNLPQYTIESGALEWSEGVLIGSSIDTSSMSRDPLGNTGNIYENELVIYDNTTKLQCIFAPIRQHLLSYCYKLFWRNGGRNTTM